MYGYTGRNIDALSSMRRHQASALAPVGTLLHYEQAVRLGGTMEGVACLDQSDKLYDPISIWEIDMGHRYGIWYIEMVMYHINMVIMDLDMRHGLMTRDMTVTIRSSPISIWDILSLWPWRAARREPTAQRRGPRVRACHDRVWGVLARRQGPAYPC
jgi:hypothetical protein